MTLPEDFGLGPAATLSHVATTARSPIHATFWTAWIEALAAETPRLTPMSRPGIEAGDPGVNVWYESLKHARIGGALFEPRGAPKAGVVVLHGYQGVRSLADERDRARALCDAGLAVLAIRVRGYPGSCFDVPDLTSLPRGWIGHGLDAMAIADGRGLRAWDAWSLSLAVGDAANAVRALRHQLHGAPIFLWGESFGGGLGVLAASALASSSFAGEGVDRLALGLPSLGDWDWRLRQPFVSGMASQVRSLISDLPSHESGIVDSLRLFDASIHASRARCPALVKLALRDEVVPAPSASAIANALGSSPGLKWRFVTRYGHFDGGIADARRHALFERLVPDFLDPARRAEEILPGWNILDLAT